VSGSKIKSLSDTVQSLDQRWDERVRPLGALLVDLYHYVGLFLIGAATVWSAGQAFFGVILKSHAGVEDLLLLFIYLEIGAMVGIYFKTNHMPVRFLMYVAITAVTRHLIGILNHTKDLGLDLLVTSGTLLTLAFALLAIRYASFHFPTGPARPESFKTDLDRG
jgi:protein PsiE